MYKKHHNRNQHGIATLGITLMLLFVMTLVALYTAKTSIKEQQISANQYRADQSMATGNGALDWGVAYIAAARGGYCEKGTSRADCLAMNGVCILSETLIDILDNNTSAECAFIYDEDNRLYIDPSVTEDTYHKKALSRGKSEMYYAFVEVDEDCNGDEVIGGECDHIPVKGGGVPDIYRTPVKIYGVGHSDDDTGIRTASVTTKTGNVFGEDGPGGINFPLITKSLVSKNAGGLTVINRYDNRTILSGSGQILEGNTHTYVAKPGTNCHDSVNRSICINMLPDLGTDMEASEGRNKINSDVIDGNENLSQRTNDEFFADFFGKSKEVMKGFIELNGQVFSNAKSWRELMYTDQTLVDPAYEGPPLSPLIWIEGDYTPEPDNNAYLGTDRNPVLLIINGDFRAGGNVNIVGILYVLGEWAPGSNNSVRGVVIVESGLDGKGGGNATIVYDADLLNGTTGPPAGTVAAAIPGGWKDW